MIQQKEEVKRNESETQKLLDVLAAQCNDTLLEKSMKDYQLLVQ